MTDSRKEGAVGVGVGNPATPATPATPTTPATPVSSSSSGAGMTDAQKKKAEADLKKAEDAKAEAARKDAEKAQEQEKRNEEERQIKAIQDKLAEIYRKKKGNLTWPLYVNTMSGEGSDQKLPDASESAMYAVSTRKEPSGLKDGLFMTLEDHEHYQKRLAKYKRDADGALKDTTRHSNTIYHKVRVIKQKDDSFLLYAVPRVEIFRTSRILGRMVVNEAYKKSMRVVYEHAISCGVSMPRLVLPDPNNLVDYQIKEKIAEMRVHLELAKEYGLPFNLDAHGQAILVRHTQDSPGDADFLQREILEYSGKYNETQEKLKQEKKAEAEKDKQKKEADDAAVKARAEKDKERAAAMEKAAAEKAAAEKAAAERAGKAPAGAGAVVPTAVAAGSDIPSRGAPPLVGTGGIPIEDAPEGQPAPPAEGGSQARPVAVALEEFQLDKSVVNGADVVANKAVEDTDKLEADLTSPAAVTGKMQELEADCTALQLAVNRLGEAEKELQGWVDGTKVSVDESEKERQIKRISDSMLGLVGVTGKGLGNLKKRIEAMDGFVETAPANLQGGAAKQEENRTDLLNKSRLVKNDLLPKLDDITRKTKELKERAAQGGAGPAPTPHM
ncbi:MAG TPA: hypothetical protein VNC84_04445 [Gammaproteobacteria bacterium]|nr:hypothetical protein [Gammaproteobacteria bacterium]